MLSVSSQSLRRAAVLTLCAFGFASTALAAKLPQLVLSGPGAIVSVPLVHMVDSGALAELSDHVSFVQWRDPDQLRVMALGGKTDVLATPSNVAANLYNRGAPIKMLDISTWGALWMVSRDPNKKTLADFRGEEIAMPFRGDMPDIVFQLLAAKQGLDVHKDFKLRYVASPIDAMQLLIMRRTDNALLADPAVSMALRKTKSFPLQLVAPTLYRSVDLQKEWGRLFNRRARIPQAGLAVVGALRKNPEAMAKIEAAYAHSTVYCSQHALECGQIMAKHVPMLSAQAVADAIAVSQMEVVPMPQARPELTFFFQQLEAKSPALIGGKLPDDGFYAPIKP